MHPQASGIVSSRSRASWPPTRIWISTKSAPSSASVELAGQGEAAAVALALEHPLRQAADHLAPLGVDVVQHQLVERHALALAREAGHELGRVGGPRSDHRELHPFTPVSVTPSTNARCAQKKSRITGAMNSSVAAMVTFHSTWCVVRKCDSPTDSGQFCGLSEV